ncbi:MAG: TetR/AcrR family transcriptional regulator [Thermodesulfobacteriota bacterium]
MNGKRAESTATTETAATQKRSLIIQAAIEVFAEHGYYNSRVSDIVKRVDAAQGVFYYYFRSKEEVLVTIFREAWSNLLKRIERINAKEEGTLAKLRGVAEYIFRSFRHNPALMKVLIMDLPRLDRFYDEENQALYNRLFEEVADLVREGQRKGLINKDISPMVASYIFHGAIDALIRHYLYNPNFDETQFPIEEAVDQVVQVLLNGLVKVTMT